MGPGAAEAHIKLADPAEATYLGRVRKNFDMLDVRSALASDAALAEALRVVQAQRAIWRVEVREGDRRTH